MSLKLSKNNTVAYDYLSEDGDMTNPAVRQVVIDKTGDPAEVVSDALELYLIGTDEGEGDIGGYTDIKITPSTAQTGLTWEISLDGGTTWAAFVEPSAMDVSSAHQIVPVHVRVKGDNSAGTPLQTNNYAAEFAIEAKQNPPAL